MFILYFFFYSFFYYIYSRYFFKLKVTEIYLTMG